MGRHNKGQANHRRMAIAEEAARLMQEHGQRDFQAAKIRAEQRLGLESRGALPSNAEIAQAMAGRNRIFHPDSHPDMLDAQREAALWMMHELVDFDPRLTGAVLHGVATEASSIELHLFSDAVEAVGVVLDELRLPKRSHDSRLRMQNRSMRSFPGYRCHHDGFDFNLVVFPERSRGHAPLSAVDGRPMRRAKPRDVEALLAST